MHACMDGLLFPRSHMQLSPELNQSDKSRKMSWNSRQGRGGWDKEASNRKSWGHKGTGATGTKIWIYVDALYFDSCGCSRIQLYGKFLTLHLQISCKRASSQTFYPFGAVQAMTSNSEDDNKAALEYRKVGHVFLQHCLGNCSTLDKSYPQHCYFLAAPAISFSVAAMKAWLVFGGC